MVFYVSCFFPDTVIGSTYQIDFEKLYAEGVRGIIFDIDNTLVEHGMDADKRAIALFARLKKLGSLPAFYQITNSQGWNVLIVRSRHMLFGRQASRPAGTITML